MDAIEVGDWVKLRGLLRVYEVVRVKTIGLDSRPLFRVAGNGMWHTPEAVEHHAPRFWIRKRPATT